MRERESERAIEREKERERESERAREREREKERAREKTGNKVNIRYAERKHLKRFGFHTYKKDTQNRN